MDILPWWSDPDVCLPCGVVMKWCRKSLTFRENLVDFPRLFDGYSLRKPLGNCFKLGCCWRNQCPYFTENPK